MTLLKAIGLAVREHRENVGFSQEQLAARAGLHRTYIGGVERGERNPSLKALRAISDALGIKASLLLTTAEKLEST